MIDERMQELASLYVLGALTPQELQDFETALARTPELQQLIAKLFATRDALAGEVALAQPRPELKEKILQEIEAIDQGNVRPTVPSRRQNPWSWLGLLVPWALAACLMVFSIVLWSQRDRLQIQLGKQALHMQDLDQMAKTLMSETNDLHQAVTALQNSTRLSEMRIALLNSLLADSPKAVAVSLWDNAQQQGVFLVQNLKPLPADKDYQLWVMDPKYATPVSAGVFQVDAQGRVRFQFTPDKTISSAHKFAVTMERKGGVPVPTLKNLVLIGS